MAAPFCFKTVIACIILLFIWELVLRDGVYKIAVILNNRVQNARPSNMVFKQLDLDSNGQLSFEEWTPHFHQSSELLSDLSNLPLLRSATAENYVFEENDSVLSIKASFEPLSLNSTMKNFKEENSVRPGSMLGLLNWQVPYKPWKNFAAQQFAMFLPPEMTTFSVGSVWWIVAPQQIQQLPSNHYESQHISSSTKLLHMLLEMFHPGVSLLTRFPPQGTAAVLRALNNDMADIYFRAHVEFQLNEEPALPFWFTPAQFQGRVIINKNASQVSYFSMAVPNSRPLNVDMEWLFGLESDQMEVDIGYIPEMKLESTSASIDRHKLGDMQHQYIQGPNSHSTGHIPDYAWTAEIPESEALSILESRFFSFKSVPYYNITDVFQKARVEDKLVHTLVLFGSLDDQSC